MSISEDDRKSQELAAQAQELVSSVKTYATLAAMAPTSFDRGPANLLHLKPLLHVLSFGGFGTDEERETITDELLRALPSKTALAIELGRHFCTEFEREFGPESGCAELLDSVNPMTLHKLTVNLGKAITSMMGGDDTLFPQGVSGDLSLHYLSEAHQTFIALTTWADEELAKELSASK